LHTIKQVFKTQSNTLGKDNNTTSRLGATDKVKQVFC